MVAREVISVTPCLRCAKLTANRLKECTQCLDKVNSGVVRAWHKPRGVNERVRIPNLPTRARCGGGYRVLRRNHGGD